jgi:hypothetical protein
MNFKEYLIKEDPDGVGEKLSYSDIDALTVVIFKNCYLYASTRDITHEQMMFCVYLNNITANDLSGLDEVKKTFMLQVLENKHEWFPHDLVKVVGRLNPSYKKKLIKEYNDAIEYGYKDIEHLRSRVVYDKMVVDRMSLITRFRDILFARVWKNSRVISFWNVASSVNLLKNDVYNFLRSLGFFARKFKYEIGDELLDYFSFDSGKRNGSNTVDLSKLHTLGPVEKKLALQGLGSVPRKPVDLQTRMLSRGE